MIQPSHPDDLPDDLPTAVHKSIYACISADSKAQDTIPWGRFPGFVLQFRQRWGHPTIDAHLGVLSHPDKAMVMTTDAVRRMCDEGRLTPQPGTYVGCAVISEGSTLADGVDMPSDDTDSDEMETWYADAVATGQARQFRAINAHFATGWKFQMYRYRHGDDLDLRIWLPDEQWPLVTDLNHIIAALHARLMAL